MPERYRTIVADPPWQYSTSLVVTGNAPGRKKQTGRSGTPYKTLTVQEVSDIPVAQLADPAGAHLYLWTTNTHLEFAWEIARHWGFTPKNLLTWCKPPKGMIGFGAFSQSSEFVLFASSTPQATHHGRSERTWFEWPRAAHSRKPEAFLDLVETVSPGPYLEMFARRNRLGWDTWGNESFEHVELADWADATERGR